VTQAVHALHQAVAAREACPGEGGDRQDAEQPRPAADERMRDACVAVCSALSLTEAGALAEAMTGVLPLVAAVRRAAKHPTYAAQTRARVSSTSASHTLPLAGHASLR